jgi:hypothetical protein
LKNFRFFTDYQNFALGYNCKNLGDGEASEDIMWLGVSKRKLPEEAQAKIDNFIDTYFDRSALKKYKHTTELDCDYESEVFA